MSLIPQWQVDDLNLATRQLSILSNQDTQDVFLSQTIFIDKRFGIIPCCVPDRLPYLIIGRCVRRIDVQVGIEIPVQDKEECSGSSDRKLAAGTDLNGDIVLANVYFISGPLAYSFSLGLASNHKQTQRIFLLNGLIILTCSASPIMVPFEFTGCIFAVEYVEGTIRMDSLSLLVQNTTVLGYLIY